jgi:predicted DNA binding protein
MSVIIEVLLPADDFELGRILDVGHASAIELENLVPAGDATVPLFWAYEPLGDGFLDVIADDPATNSVTEMDVFKDRTLFRLDWDARQDHLFQCLLDNEGQILGGSGTSERWDFEIQFPDREALGQWQDCCDDARLSVDVVRIYNPTDPGAGPWYGLSGPQREALILAVREGYYDIPRVVRLQPLPTNSGFRTRP